VTDGLDAALAAYAWLDADDPRLSALSLTLVRATPDEAVARLRPIRALDGPMTLGEAGDAVLDDFDGSRLVVQVDALDGWATLIEPFGWAGTDAGVLARLSAGGRAVNVLWNVNAVMHAGWADDGAVVRSFDPLLDDRRDDRLPEDADLPFGEPDAALRAAFVLAERLTGVRIERDWLLERRRPAWEIATP
jgi:hypothetical protein